VAFVPSKFPGFCVGFLPFPSGDSFQFCGASFVITAEEESL
jgi:hypothetical protein